MIDINRKRDGALTEITAVCDSDTVANQATSLFEKFGRIVKRDGLVISTTSNKRDAADLVSALERLSYRTAPTAKQTSPVPAGQDLAGRQRELILANLISEKLARENPPFINGRPLQFSGFGAEFIGTEVHGDMWGERVRYAYYV